MNKILKYLFFLILIVFPLGQLFRLNLSNFIPGLRIHLFDATIFVFTFVWLLKKIFKKERISLPILSKELFIFSAVATISLFLQIFKLKIDEFFGSFFYLLRFLNTIAFLFAVTEVLKKENLPVFDYLLGEGIFIAFFSLLQYIVLPDTRFLLNFGWDEHYFRAIGTFLDPSFAGLLLVLSFFVWVTGFAIESRKNIIFWVTGLILLLAIGLTFSRVAYLSLITGLGAIFLPRKNFRVFAFFCSIIIIIILLIPKPGGEGVDLLRVSSFIARSDNYKYSLAIIKDNFWTGVGFNAFRFSQKKYGFISLSDWKDTNAGAGADNSFLFVLATTGIFGLVAFLNFWIKAVYKSNTLAKSSKSSLILFSSLIAMSPAALVVNCLFYQWISIWLMILLARFTVDN